MGFKAATSSIMLPPLTPTNDVELNLKDSNGTKGKNTTHTSPSKQLQRHLP
jgi:hypothetical protein